MSITLVKQCDLKMTPLPPMSARAASGSPMTMFGIVDAPVKVVDSTGHKLVKTVPFVAADLHGYDVYYGMPFIERHLPILDYQEKTVRWQPQARSRKCSYQRIALESANQFQNTLEEGTADVYAILVTHDSYGESVTGIEPLVASIGPNLAPNGLEECYQDYADVFSEDLALELPPHAPQDLPILLEEGKQPPHFPLYNMSEVELSHLRKYIAEYLRRGWIRRSSSPAGAPILFAKKKDGSLRLCVDYRGLNKVTIKNRGPLPLISESLDRLAKARIFSKFDVRDGYHRIRIREGDEWKTAFRTRYGHFEYLVMPFGLTNAPAQFQSYIHQARQGLVDVICVVYLDDILVFSDTLEEHKDHVRQILARLRQYRLFLKRSKCEFHTRETEFLGFIITPEGLKADASRISAIQDWPMPATVRDIRIFIGFVNYYRRFIANFSRLALPLTRLTQKGPDSARGGRAQRREESVCLNIGQEGRQAFLDLKNAFLNAPILAHYEPSRPTKVETDASKGAIAGILSQLVYNEQLGKTQWRPIDFFSQKLSGPSLNYDTHDKELLAIIRSLEHWEKYLRGVPQAFELYTDHNNLKYFQTTKKLTERQCRWSEYLQRFDFAIQYRPGKINPADGPSRRPDYLKYIREDADEYNQENLEKLRSMVGHVNPLSPLMVSAVQTRSAKRVRTSVLEGAPLSTPLAPQLPPISSERPEWPSLAQNGPQVAPRKPQGVKVLGTPEERAEALWECHDDPMAGHFGFKKTLHKMKRRYKWVGMDKDVSRYCKECLLCQRAKAPKHAPYGLLNPLQPPDGPWQDVTMDFITDLPPCKYLRQVYDSILVIVCRLTKMAHYVPVWSKITATEYAEVWLREVIRLHGVPRTIISDRGPLMNSKYWNTFCHYLGTKRVLTSAYHPQTDGQTERQNQTLEQYLRCYCNLEQDDWACWLPMAEFAYNDSTHAVTGYTPFEAYYGVDPRGTNWPGLPLKGGDAPLAHGVAAKVVKLQQTCKQRIAEANAYQKRHADERRRLAPFRVGDQVLIATRNLRSLRPKKKLDWKFTRPGRVVAQIGPAAYRVDCPDLKGNHPVFHASQLEQFHPQTEVQHPDA